MHGLLLGRCKTSGLHGGELYLAGKREGTASTVHMRCSHAFSLQCCDGSHSRCLQLTAQTRPLTSNDINTLVQGVRAAQVNCVEHKQIS